LKYPLKRRRTEKIEEVEENADLDENFINGNLGLTNSKYISIHR